MRLWDCLHRLSNDDDGLSVVKGTIISAGGSVKVCKDRLMSACFAGTHPHASLNLSKVSIYCIYFYPAVVEVRKIKPHTKHFLVSG